MNLVLHERKDVCGGDAVKAALAVLRRKEENDSKWRVQKAVTEKADSSSESEDGDDDDNL
jgi:hypothetical protein